MVVKGGEEPFNISENFGREFDGEPDSWSSRPSLFTDLNSPVLSPDANGPIAPDGPDGPRYSAQFPILDPLSVDRFVGGLPAKGTVPGFKIVNPPGYGGSGFDESTDPTQTINGRSANPAPMPVRWLYILQNGAVTAPSGMRGDEVTAHWDDLADGDPGKPTQDNPIVGRIAFWTDDETCKVNLNTAGQGVWWDRPWAEGGVERSYAKDLPKQNEFQRYAGHPATTSLSAVFGSLFPVPVSAGSTSPVMRPYVGQNLTQASLAPRLNAPTDLESYQSGSPNAKRVRVRGDRLYASVDELFFRVPASGSTNERIPFNGDLDRSFMERIKFFATASSRAPEVNLFNKPRISLWPLQANAPVLNNPGGRVDDPEKSPWRNAKDKLIAFCSSTTQLQGNGRVRTTTPYYFQRYSVFDRKTDGRSIFQRPIPSCYRWRDDWDKIPRNVQLYDYIRNELMESPVPGYGGTFLAKYRDDRDQILTSMFDTIRGGINSYSTGLQPYYEYLPPRGSPRPGETQAVPFTNPKYQNAKGFGRFTTISEAAIQFFCSKFSEGNNGQPRIPKEMRAVVILEPFNPSVGPASWSHHVKFKMYFGSNRSGEQPLSYNFPNGVKGLIPFIEGRENLVTSRVGYSGGGHTTAFMGLQSFFRCWLNGGEDKNKNIGGANIEGGYPYISETITIPPGAKTFTFEGGDLTIEIHYGYPDPDAKGDETLVQTIKMKFPAVKDLPVPDDAAVDYQKRLSEALDPNWNDNFRSEQKGIFRPGDVVRSVEANTIPPHNGDLRFFCAMQTVPNTWFSQTPGYDQSANRIVHGLRQTCWEDRQVYVKYSNINGRAFTGQPATLETGGRLVANAPYSSTRIPAVPRGLNGALNFESKPGDWDNGPGFLEDGPYINKPDEGNVATGDASYYSRGSFNVEEGATFSPNRQVSSGVVFGSLPTGIYSGKPWQTLLFCSHPAAGDSSWSAVNKAHFGARTSGNGIEGVGVPDHVLLDFFTMPIVEPYAISEPFSTAGKINLNYEIAPFNYIKRDTGLRAVLQSTKIFAVAASEASSYKTNGGNFRKDINLDETIKAFERRFADNRPFISAGEICEMPLVPKDGNARENALASWWASKALTGDNAREYPYGHIYPRITTKSNTFTVHYRVQTLRKSTPGSSRKDGKESEAWSEWDENKDSVVGEQRGSTTIERYIDSHDPALAEVDFADIKTKRTLDEFYKFRIISNKRFTP
jgi:uncharacterized protein (TIGR02600 family)